MSKQDKQAKVEKVSSITFNNYHLRFINDWITILKSQDSKGDTLKFPLMLHGKISRSRNQIVTIVGSELEKLEKERLVLLDKYGDKNEKGELLMEQDGKNYKLKDKAGFEKEFDELMDGKVTLDILPSNREHWNMVKNLIINDNKSSMDFNETKVYEEVCTILETL